MERQKHLRPLRLVLATLLALFCSAGAWAQQGIEVTGKVLDQTGESVIGASVVVKGNAAQGAITDFDGVFKIRVPNDKATLVVSYIGMESQEIKVGQRRKFTITLAEDRKQLEEVVVVGYGQQKKASVVGAITQTTGKVLERSAGIHDVGAALTGNLPGVITTQSSGQPGADDVKIVIRGSSSWNSSDPLVLVDGIERPLSAVDVSSVETISVLKDASATAVYGVKGANGVILITTKRGVEGKAKIDVGFNATLKTASKLPNKLDSYDALMRRNQVVERELGISPSNWSSITPQSSIEMYRNQTTVEQRERYPNVDWQDVLFKDAAMSYNANINVSGGSKFVRYFLAVDYINESDLFRTFSNNRGYDPGFGYNRINARSNLDFSLTKTTSLKVNIAGSNSAVKSPWTGSTSFDSSNWNQAQMWAGAYGIAPNSFMPVYSDGSYGYRYDKTNISNSVQLLALGGEMTTTTTRITTDFTLEQDLKFITPGLKACAMIAWDNVFVEAQRGVNDLNHAPQTKWIDPETGEATYGTAYNSVSMFDYYPGTKWTTSGGSVQNGSTQRHLNYQLQLNWARTFGKHDVTATGVFTRQESSWNGYSVPSYREDWVFRTTYAYNNRYFAEYNGAYNGSEKFSKENRFAFFNSGAVGWMISEEPFMKFLKEKKILDMLKIRFSYGEVGDDSGNRWLYMTQWATSGSTALDLYGLSPGGSLSPYQFYYQTSLGNPDVHWEKVVKKNLGIDYAFFGGLISGTFEFFKDKRSDILVSGSSRAIPSYYGATAPTANLGRAQSTGYELELRLNKTFTNGLHLWGNFNMTHAENKILDRDDAQLLPSYQKQAGYAIGQTHSYIDSGHMNTFDDIYGSPKRDTSNELILPGDYYVVDYNGDGVIDKDDSVPYGYTSTPQNTYNATVGFEWKGFSFFAQFYGVTNVTRDVSLTSFGGGNQVDTVYDKGAWWSKDNVDGLAVPRWGSTPSYYYCTETLYDGSYIRLKNVEIAYTFTSGWIKSLGMKTLKIYLNGNNLWSWSRMPDDRESNFSGASYIGAYPMMKRFNLGVKFTL